MGDGDFWSLFVTQTRTIGSFDSGRVREHNEPVYRTRGLTKNLSPTPTADPIHLISLAKATNHQLAVNNLSISAVTHRKPREGAQKR